MINELGHFALIMGFVFACIQAVSSLAGAQLNSNKVIHIGRHAAFGQFICLALAFLALLIAFIRSDFSLLIVAMHSHVAKPLMYKIAGTWGNHEGSMLLWVLVMAAYGAAFAMTGKQMAVRFRAHVLGVQGGLGICFIAFCLFAANPFTRLIPAPFEGGGLNPILQDPALAAHPPLLYIGYVGFSLAFSFALAALIEGDMPRQWARCLRPWVLFAWLFLTLGIALGSYWAYYELGWGGFWFWDPVENASLMPWLSGTALLHAILVADKRDMMRRWCVLLAILTFGLCIIGTFLVRSGILTSVHAFANDPQRGIFILTILAVVMGGALLLYARYGNRLLSSAMRSASSAKSASSEYGVQPLSRETALLANNVFLACATATVFIGTLYPLAIDALGLGRISVGAPYFNAVFAPLMIPLFLILPFGPLLAWGAGRWRMAWWYLRAAFILAVLAGVSVAVMQQGATGGALLGIAGAVWLLAGALADMAAKIKLGQTSLRQSIFLLRHLPGTSWGSILAHGGIGVMLFGIIATTAWRSELITMMQPGDEVMVSSYRIKFVERIRIDGPNYEAERGLFHIERGDRNFTLMPEKRFYQAERSQTTEAAIDKKLRAHLYMALGDSRLDENGETEQIVRIWIHPYVAFIWFGAVFMACGAGVSLLSRIRRRGADRSAEVR